MFIQNEFIQYAKNLGFLEVGFAEARKLNEESPRLDEWLSKGFHGTMEYMERNRNLRLDPRELVPGCRSVIVLLYNYYQIPAHEETSFPKISRYAQGQDYHKVLRRKNKLLLNWLNQQAGAKVLRGVVDSAPVMERQWAKLAGLVWNGKNTLSIHPQQGSYFFISCLFTDITFEYGQPIKDYCGTCTRCIDACPTQAILTPGYRLNASRCISYLTIEQKTEISSEFKGLTDNWLFGCDICQEVCPWNRFSKPHSDPAFESNPETLNKSPESWLNLDQSSFENEFNHSPLKRKGLTGIQNTIRFLGETPP